MPLFNAHHYNILAKEIRELWETETKDDPYLAGLNAGNQATLSNMVLNLSRRFAQDNELFEPIRFMEAAIPEDARKTLIEKAISGA